MGSRGAQDLKPDEDPAEGVLALYDRHAARFAALRAAGPWRDEIWLRRFAIRLPARARVLDLGCGPGVPVAAFLVSRGFSVTGVDGAPAMIETARARFPAGDWRCADMRGLALGETFEGVLAWDSFFHLPAPDQRTMFSIFAAHAAPNAHLLFNTGPAAGVAIGAFEGEPLHHASLDPEGYRAALAAAGFEVLRYAPQDDEAGGRSVWLARKV